MRVLCEQFALERLKTERSLYVSDPGDLKDWRPYFSRLYFGSEFCEQLIPGQDQIAEILDFARQQALDFTFLSPPVTAKGLDRLAQAADFLRHAAGAPGLEVVINDWGALDILTGLNCSLSLGRLLVRQMTDPEIMNIQGRMTPEEFLQFSAVKLNPPMSRFIRSQGIDRVEIDHPLSGLCLEDKCGLKVHLYVPFGVVTASRMCHYVYIKDKKTRLAIPPRAGCRRDCMDGYLVLNNHFYDQDLYVKGNVVFFRNDSIPEELIEAGLIDRIIFQPTLPH